MNLNEALIEVFLKDVNTGKYPNSDTETLGGNRAGNTPCRGNCRKYTDPDSSSDQGKRAEIPQTETTHGSVCFLLMYSFHKTMKNMTVTL